MFSLHLKLANLSDMFFFSDEPGKGSFWFNHFVRPSSCFRTFSFATGLLVVCVGVLGPRLRIVNCLRLVPRQA